MSEKQETLEFDGVKVKVAIKVVDGVKWYKFPGDAFWQTEAKK